ncbi:MAG TPA: hypothetical protein VFI73_07370 [Candidatus Nitrosopolaris sp.]|nr:hypothetical protein [Candidatus Nitrosopolaris sp.]
MHKNTYANVPTLSAIAISAILLTSFTMVGMQLSQHALAQNATSATPSTNATSATPSTNNTGAQEPPVGQSFVWQGTASSQISPLGPSHAKEYVAAVLKPRADGAVYSGVLTYTASKGVNVEIWHAYNPGNTSALASKTFGSVKTASYNGMNVAVVDLSASGASGSVPFSGNAVLLHATSPFTVTYTVNAVAQTAKTTNNVQSSMAAAPPAVPKKLTTGNSTSSSSSSSSKSSKSSKPPQPTTLE